MIAPNRQPPSLLNSSGSTAGTTTNAVSSMGPTSSGSCNGSATSQPVHPDHGAEQDGEGTDERPDLGPSLEAVVERDEHLEHEHHRQERCRSGEHVVGGRVVLDGVGQPALDEPPFGGLDDRVVGGGGHRRTVSPNHTDPIYPAR